MMYNMDTDAKQPQTIDEYIADFPPDVQAKLQQIRATIRQTAPELRETIKYQMPTFMLNGNVVHFAAFKNHIGFYPTPSGTEQFQAELAPYKYSKGAIQFPLNEPIPFDLIARIVEFRVAEDRQRAEAKRKKK